MKQLVESLSLGSGAILVAILSVAIVWLLSSVVPQRLRVLWVVIEPLVLAYCLYWSPVWLGADASEYGVWKFIVVIWFLAGFFPSAVLVLILQKRRAK